MDRSQYQPFREYELQAGVQQPATTHRRSTLVRILIRICLVVVLFYLCGFQITAKAIAQCATCQAGGHCAMNQNGTCMANRTFWGYYPGNWRKWPTVAAQEAAAANAPPRQTPADMAPSSVLPSPEDEARTSTPNTSSAPSESKESGSSRVPGESPVQGLPKSKLPGDTAPLQPKTDPAKDLFPNTTLPAPEDPATKPKPMPKNDAVRPALPGTLLDDPAPTPPVDPNDRVPNLPPTLQDLEPGKEAPSLDDLFKTDETEKLKSPGEASMPRGNEPASVRQASSELTEERSPDHGRFANGVLGMKPAAANMPSTAGSTLDEISEFERPGARSALDTASLELPEVSEPAPAETGPSETRETDESEGPELLLSPEDTTEVTNPLRNEFIHARYAARMFTPQSKTAEKSSAGEGRKSSSGASATEFSSVNPLRSAGGAPSPHGHVLPVSYEEPDEKDSSSINETAVSSETIESVDNKPNAAVSEQSANVPAVEEASLLEEPTPAEPILSPAATELPREHNSAPQTLQRKRAEEPESENALRTKRPWDRAQNLSNPLRAGERTSSAAPGKTLATGRYAATVAAPRLESRTANSQATGVSSTPVSAIGPETFAPRRDNPLRSGF